MTPYVKYTPEHMAMLDVDVEKRQLYIERYTDCIVPCILDFGELVRTKRHLLEDSGSIFGFLHMIFAAQAPTINWQALDGTVFLSVFLLCAYGEAWRPLLKCWSKGDHSIMQPVEPSTVPLVFMTLQCRQNDYGHR
jgi:hypothetical protein